MAKSKIKLLKGINGLLLIARIKHEDGKYYIDTPLVFTQTQQGLGFGEFLEFGEKSKVTVSESFIDNNFIIYDPEDALIKNYEEAIKGIKFKKSGLVQAGPAELKNLGNVTPFIKK